MARVTGIGGVFLRSDDPQRLSRWYTEHLGLPVGEYGAADLLWSDEIPPGTGQTVWSAFPRATSYLGEVAQTVMVN